MTERFRLGETEWDAFAREWLPQWPVGTVIALVGPLGAGKTTFVRAVLRTLGYLGPVRSPTYNLIQVFETCPPVAHADLYRLETTHESDPLWLAEEMEQRLSFIEWPDRVPALFAGTSSWKIKIDFDEDPNFRIVSVDRPKG